MSSMHEMFRNFYMQKYKTLKREIKEDQNNGQLYFVVAAVLLYYYF